MEEGMEYRAPHSNMGPASIFSTSFMVVTPVSMSPLKQCVLDGRRAPVLGQQGAVHIDAAQARGVEHRFTKEVG